jgi:hypothetical protein
MNKDVLPPATKARRDAKHVLAQKKKYEETAEEMKKREERESIRKEINAIPTFYLSDVAKKIKQAVSGGAFSVNYGVHNCALFQAKLVEAIRAQGYTATLKSEYQEPVHLSGDSSSGEMNHDGYTKHWIEISWEK